MLIHTIQPTPIANFFPDSRVQIGIWTIAGNGQGGYYNGDDQLATLAVLDTPHGVWMNSVGDLYVADTGNGLVRMVDRDTGK